MSKLHRWETISEAATIATYSRLGTTKKDVDKKKDAIRKRIRSGMDSGIIKHRKDPENPSKEQVWVPAALAQIERVLG